HCADVHLGESDLAEKEATSPEGTGERAGKKAESAGGAGTHLFHANTKRPSESVAALPLPDATGVGGDHGCAGFAAECRGEAGLIDHHAVDANVVWGVWIAQHLG